MVRGIARTAEDIRKEARMYGYGLSGATVAKEQPNDSTILQRNIIGKIRKEDDRPTEFRSGE